MWRLIEATAAVDAGLKWVGDTTGISTPKGKVLVVAADRKKPSRVARRSTS